MKRIVLASVIAPAEKSAVAEVTLNAQTDTVRAKQYVKVNGRLYLIGIECGCKEN